VWLDGKQVLDRTNVVFRLKPDVLIERFTARNFFGGSNDLFRPKKNQYMWCAAPLLLQGVTT
jgi:hypothetical protein